MPAPGTFTRSPTFWRQTGWRASAPPNAVDRWSRAAVKDPLEDAGVEVDERTATGILLAFIAALVALAVFVPGSRTPLILIVGIILMVMLHEFGHYITAKRAGMKVTEFFLGFGPRLWSFTPRRDRVRREGASRSAATCASSA